MIFLLDIGGTHIRAAISDGESLLAKKMVDTPQSLEDGVDTILQLAHGLEIETKIDMCVCGVPGVLAKDKNSLFVVSNLPSWSGKPIASLLSEKLTCPVKLENDAALAGLGEAAYGAGKDHEIVMYYTVSTGVGGARIVHKKIDVHTYGMEPGHQIIDFDKSAIREADSIEDLVSGSGIEEHVGKDSTTIDDKDFWDKRTYELSVALYNSILHWSPDVVILGGAIINADVIRLETIHEHLSSLMKLFPELPELKKAELGDDAGLWGALAHAIR